MLLSVDDQVERDHEHARVRGPARQHLRDLPLGQRLLRRRAPHPPGQVPAARALEPRADDDPRARASLPGQISETLVSNVDVATTIADIANATPTLQQDGRSLLPFAAVPVRRDPPGRSCSRATPAPSIDDDGTETATPPARRRRPEAAEALLQEAQGAEAEDPQALPRAQADQQEPRPGLRRAAASTTSSRSPPTRPTSSRPPPTAALRTDRYALFLYSTGELELYDMKKDPGQLESVHRDKRYALVRQWLLDEAHRVPQVRRCGVHHRGGDRAAADQADQEEEAVEGAMIAGWS